MKIEKKQMVRNFMLALMLGATVLSTAACNTVRGVGDDLNSAADAVDEET